MSFRSIMIGAKFTAPVTTFSEKLPTATDAETASIAAEISPVDVPPPAQTAAPAPSEMVQDWPPLDTIRVGVAMAVGTIASKVAATAALTTSGRIVRMGGAPLLI